VHSAGQEEELAEGLYPGFVSWILEHHRTEGNQGGLQEAWRPKKESNNYFKFILL
jgi:hypothetical protein